jgi:hypothetical protein
VGNAEIPAKNIMSKLLEKFVDAFTILLRILAIRTKWKTLPSPALISPLVSFYLDHKINEFVRTLEQKLMWYASWNTDDVSG